MRRRHPRRSLADSSEDDRDGDAKENAGAPLQLGATARGDDPRLNRRIAAGAAVGVCLTATTAVITATSGQEANSGLAATARAMMVAVPVAVGLYAWHRRPQDRFGPLLMLAGFGWFLTTLAESGDSVVYSVGRVAGWFVEASLIYLILSFPSGRLTGRGDRVLVWLALGLVALLYLPTALLAQDFPTPTPYSGCVSDCPDNAFFMLGAEPGYVDALQPVRDLLTALLFGAVTLRLALRLRDATPLMRITSTPVLGVAAARLAVLAAAAVARAAGASSGFLAALMWISALALPLIAAAFLVGLFRWRLHVAGALESLGSRILKTHSPGELRQATADTLDDPTLEVIYRRSGDEQWVDSTGRVARLPDAGSGRCITEVRNGQRWIAGIVHDEALLDEREFIEAVASYALVALENERLVESSLRQVRESRARIVATADRERRRIERDLHDGAQQHLVSLRIQLELTEELLRKDPVRGLEKLHGLGTDVDDTLDSIRSLAHGVYPSLLADRGLAEALRSAGRSSPIAVSVEPDGAGRYPQDIESAVYFSCLEALQNAAKHATNAERITISLTAGDGLLFEVRDDGEGFDTEAASDGVGLANIRDRLAAVGGDLEISSSAGNGTLIAGRVPLPDADGNGLHGRFTRG